MAKFLRFLFWICAIAGVGIGLARATALRWWQVPSESADPYLIASIAPTLRAGDWVILWRLTKPAYGALVLCPEPSTNNLVIGRLVGEENDLVAVKETTLFINDKPAATERACSQPSFNIRHPSGGKEMTQSCQIEVVGSNNHMRGSASGHPLRPKDFELTAKAGQAILVSDNRLFPYDSRDFGPVQRNTCTETVMFRLVSKEGFFDVANRFSFIR